jgi:hypothetical protein
MGMRVRKHIGMTVAVIYLCMQLCITAFAAAPESPAELADGEYAISLEMSGGSGKASVDSPTVLYIKDGKASVLLTWSSSNYDYMIVREETYYNESEEGERSTFTVPVEAFDEPLEMIADTTAMGTPHEITYTMTFYADSVASKGTLPQEASKRVVGVALVIIVVGGILNFFVKKRRTY